MKKFFKYATILYIIAIILYNASMLLLKMYTSYSIVHTDKKIIELTDVDIVDITAIGSDESYFALSKDGYLYTIDISTLTVKRKIYLPKLNNPQELQIITNDIRFEQIIVIDENKNFYSLVNYKYIYNNVDSKNIEPELVKISEKKFLSIKPIFIWNKNVILTSDFKEYYYNHNNMWEFYSDPKELPFLKPQSLDYSISKKYANHGYTVTDRTNNKIDIYSNGNCAGDIKEWYHSTFKVNMTPQTAAFSTGLCWAGNYHIMPRSNYWGSLLIAFKNKKGIDIYDIKNNWFTTVLHEVNKVSSFIVHLPFYPLSIFFGRQ